MKNRLFSIALILVAAAVSASADVVINLDSGGVVSGAPGGTVQFFGMLANNNTGAAFPLAFTPSGLTPDFTITTFIDNTPLSMNPGESTSPSALYMSVLIPNLIAPGSYFGTLTLTGLLDDSPEEGVLGSTPFTVIVTSPPTTVPEPGTSALLGCGAVALVWAARRRSRAAQGF